MLVIVLTFALMAAATWTSQVIDAFSVLKSLLGSIFYISTFFLTHTNFISTSHLILGLLLHLSKKKQKTVVTCSCVNSASKMLTLGF